ncbi:hypothetical protein [Paenibacillus illinoisensis]|uniref:hypothetical protein n=1 Tax=Paenibacillus illinoisensis TaxID=59845 RepID=UPI000DA21CF0|nr:hypothetical protein [Paenibacillus illinoisensis]
MQNTLDLPEIDKEETELLMMINFLFTTQEEGELLSDACCGRTGQEVNKFVYRYRKHKIKQTRYVSYEEFRDTYEQDEKKALERLFQEYINEAKYRQLECKDALTIYNKHLQDPEIRFGIFVLYV